VRQWGGLTRDVMAGTVWRDAAVSSSVVGVDFGARKCGDPLLGSVPNSLGSWIGEKGSVKIKRDVTGEI